MKNPYWIIPLLIFVYVLIFVVLIPYRRLQRYNQFQKDMKPGDMCWIYYGEEKHLGTIKPMPNGELDKIYVTVSFSDTEDYPYDSNNHKILVGNYRREEIYPV